ncbi:unnamed protein product [Tilletia controversa]|uniref:Uncharacterized protein n=1 Tax=Tilletia controversa TaxID=13291 RepID=A0A8X7MRP5_9BASI|nr:hypothetical protein CF328_g5395 [Tilletia controversa]KAE8245528.1 hypothetical protein A4X06_0g5629 [Tilletia controversa]CAD6907969.1 unnamed protein product [Tilletia controversa]CAD6934081.1 unnamed protein product [Tilletia controversa]CAD6979127.1 unnamed protein product [Tilletia controversa]
MSSTTDTRPSASTSTSTSTSTSGSKRPPALAEIAAKLKIEDKIKEQGGESPTKALRLPAAGRLNPGAPTSPAPAQHPSPAPDTPSATTPAPTTATATATGSDASTPKPDVALPAPDSNDKVPQRTASGAPKPEKPKLHPLQHVWTLYYDSKSLQNNSAANSAAPSPNPATPAQADKNKVATKDKDTEKDKELQQQQQSPLSKSSTSTLQPPGSAPAGSTTPGSTSVTSGESWEAQLKFLGKYNTVEAFFKTFATLRRPSSLDRNSNYHLFKDGIKPMWEDPQNANGGKWLLTLRGTNPALLDRTWMWLVLALIGEDLDDKNEITGAVCSTRPKGDRIALWIRFKDDIERVNSIGRRFVSLLDVEKEPGVSLEFVSNSEGRRGSVFRSHGGHHNYMRSGSVGAGAGAGGPSASSDPANTSPSEASAVKEKENNNNSTPSVVVESESSKADDSISSVGSKPAGPSKYISFSNPPPQSQFGPGGPQQHQQQHQYQQFPQGGGGGPFHPHPQQGGMPGFGGGGGGMPNGMPGLMQGMPNGGFPPGFLPPGMNNPQQHGQQQQMGMNMGNMGMNMGNMGGMMNPMAGMFPPGTPMSPQYLAAAAAAGMAPQNMHYFQHQLALQQQALFAAQMMQAQNQQSPHTGGGGGAGGGGGRGAFGSGMGTSPEKGSPSKFGSSASVSVGPAGAAAGGRRGSEMGLAGGGAFGGFVRRGSDHPSEGSNGAGGGGGGAMGAFGSPIGRKGGVGAGAGAGGKGGVAEAK